MPAVEHERQREQQHRTAVGVSRLVDAAEAETACGRLRSPEPPGPPGPVRHRARSPAPARAPARPPRRTAGGRPAGPGPGPPRAGSKSAGGGSRSVADPRRRPFRPDPAASSGSATGRFHAAARWAVRCPRLMARTDSVGGAQRPAALRTGRDAARARPCRIVRELLVVGQRPAAPGAGPAATGRRPAVAAVGASGIAQRPPRRRHELAAVLVPVARLLGQDPVEYLVNGGRQVGTEQREPGRRLLDMRPDDRRIQVLLERHPPGQALVEHAAERVLVGHAEHGKAANLLGRDVVDRAEERPGRRSGRCARWPAW